jgi:selenide,water dikinase
MSSTDTPIRLTEFSRAAGCGCKISPSVLREIIGNDEQIHKHPRLIIGYGTSDDAAAYDLGDGRALISTTDFFMPIVDDPFDFGRVAAANAISDVYAMGGTPVMATAILGWPIGKIPVEHAARVMEGARLVCSTAGIPLAGGHSIDSTEPLFGLSVNGLSEITSLKKNSTAQSGDLIFLTKPLGSGILSTALKRKVISEKDQYKLIESLTTLNNIGSELGNIPQVNSMTDVTGFGLVGHLIQMCEASQVTGEINYNAIPRFDSLKHYINLGTIPDATFRNWNAYNDRIHFLPGVDMQEAFSVMPDPQTNGGLLFTVEPDCGDEVYRILARHGLQEFGSPIGRMLPKGAKPLILAGN